MGLHVIVLFDRAEVDGHAIDPNSITIVGPFKTYNAAADFAMEHYHDSDYNVLPLHASMHW